MTRRAMTAERAELLRKATAESVIEHLRRVRGNVPAQIIVCGLIAAAVEVTLRDVKPGNRAAVIARARAALDAVERRQLSEKPAVQRSAAVTR